MAKTRRAPKKAKEPELAPTQRQAQIEAQIAIFKAQGGQIQAITTGISGIKGKNPYSLYPKTNKFKE